LGAQHFWPADRAWGKASWRAGSHNALIVSARKKQHPAGHHVAEIRRRSRYTCAAGTFELIVLFELPN
jgi:hypothetical protein